jgi:hypothetical protein
VSGGAGASYDNYNLTGINGTYTVPYVSTTSGICLYQLTFSATLDQDIHTNGTCTAFLRTDIYTQARITITITESTIKVRSAAVTSVGFPAANVFNSGVLSPNADYGDTISNLIKCDGTGITSAANSSCGVGSVVVN